MSKFIEIQGNTIAEAIQAGLNQLNLTLDEVKSEVITHPKSGFFGFGACKAKIRLTVLENTPQPVEKKEEKKPKLQTTKTEAKKDKEEIVFDIKPAKTQINDTEKVAKDFIDGLLEKMGIEGQAVVVEGKDISINIEGEGMGNVIGRRGDTLDAIQYLTNLVIKNSTEQEGKVRVDCENYRQKRELTLEKLALKMGHKVIKYRKNMTLEPMNPYERRIIHEVLQSFRGVYTYSTGKEPNRRVVIGFGEKQEK